MSNPVFWEKIRKKCASLSSAEFVQIVVKVDNSLAYVLNYKQLLRSLLKLHQSLGKVSRLQIHYFID